MDISVLIVNYNVREYIVSCIESIYKHSKSDLNFEIIVVDNNSKDRSSEKIKKKFGNISLIENNYNAGFSKAVNQAAKKAVGKYILILNPDTLFKDDSLHKLFFEAEKHQNLGALGPRLASENNLLQRSAWRSPSVLNTILSIFHMDFLNLRKNYIFSNFSKTIQVDTISGAAFFVKRSEFNNLNGFNEDLFWMEDIDFCYRANLNNLKIIYFPITTIIHFVGMSSKKNYKISISNQLLSKIKYFKIHHSAMSTIVVKLSVISVALLKSILMMFLIPFSKTYSKKNRAYFFTIKEIIFNKK